MVDINDFIINKYLYVSSELLKKYGADTAVYYAFLEEYYEYSRMHNGWICVPYKQVEEVIGLSKHKQKKAIDNLEKSGFINYKVMGIPAQNYVTLNH